MMTPQKPVQDPKDSVASKGNTEIRGEGPRPSGAPARGYKKGDLRGRGKPVAGTDAVVSKRPRLNGKVELSFSTCSKSLTNVNISRRGLLALEMAVGLAIYLDFGVANRAAKQMVMDAYAKAGYECQDHGGKDYKTVRRRIDASAGLFGKLGAEAITGWVDGKKELKLLQSVAHEVSKLEFKSMDDILDYIGRSSGNRAVKGEAENPFEITVGEGKLVRIPKNLSEAELLELAQKIMTLAEEVKMRGNTLH